MSIPPLVTFQPPQDSECICPLKNLKNSLELQRGRETAQSFAASGMLENTVSSGEHVLLTAGLGEHSRYPLPARWRATPVKKPQDLVSEHAFLVSERTSYLESPLHQFRGMQLQQNMEQPLVEPCTTDTVLEHGRESLPSRHFKLPAGKRGQRHVFPASVAFVLRQQDAVSP